MKSGSKSRRKTPWDNISSLTETQEFLKVQCTIKIKDIQEQMKVKFR